MIQWIIGILVSSLPPTGGSTLKNPHALSIAICGTIKAELEVLSVIRKTNQTCSPCRQGEHFLDSGELKISRLIKYSESRGMSGKFSEEKPPFEGMTLKVRYVFSSRPARVNYFKYRPGDCKSAWGCEDPDQKKPLLFENGIPVYRYSVEKLSKWPNKRLPGIQVGDKIEASISDCGNELRINSYQHTS